MKEYSYVYVHEELSEQIQAQIRRYRRRCKGTDLGMWYRISAAMARADDAVIYHDDISNFIMPNLFDENGDAIIWYHSRDPQQRQVNAVKRNLKISSDKSRKRGRVNKQRLKAIMMEILERRLEEYLNPKDNNMEKLKILCIVGASGSGKTLASLHMKYKKGANVICSFTTRPPRKTEKEGRDHHFIDIVPDKTEMIAYTHFAGNFYYALKTQVFGPCTIYVIDEKGLNNLKQDFGDVYDIYSVFIKRLPRLRKKVGVDVARMRRDDYRDMNENDHDYVIENNGTKKHLFSEIERIYEEVVNK